MKRKNKIIMFSTIIILLIIILVLIEIFRIRKKDIETIGGREEQDYLIDKCSECGAWILSRDYDSSSHWDYCVNGHTTNKESHDKETRTEKYPNISGNISSTDVCWRVVEGCKSCKWVGNVIETHEHEWKEGGHIDSITKEWVVTGDGWTVSGQVTCTESATARRECRNCSYYETETQGPLGHDYSKVEDMGDGQNHKLTCSRCGDEKIEKHTLANASQEQTCVNSEITGEKCTKCTYKNLSITKNPTGHKFGIGYH